MAVRLLQQPSPEPAQSSTPVLEPKPEKKKNPWQGRMKDNASSIGYTATEISSRYAPSRQSAPRSTSRRRQDFNYQRRPTPLRGTSPHSSTPLPPAAFPTGEARAAQENRLGREADEPRRAQADAHIGVSQVHASMDGCQPGAAQRPAQQVTPCCQADASQQLPQAAQQPQQGFQQCYAPPAPPPRQHPPQQLQAAQDPQQQWPTQYSPPQFAQAEPQPQQQGLQQQLPQAMQQPGFQQSAAPAPQQHPPQQLPQVAQQQHQQSFQQPPQQGYQQLPHAAQQPQWPPQHSPQQFAPAAQHSQQGVQQQLPQAAAQQQSFQQLSELKAGRPVTFVPDDRRDMPMKEQIANFLRTHLQGAKDMHGQGSACHQLPIPSDYVPHRQDFAEEVVRLLWCLQVTGQA
ncbi:hypothetical protein AK812_SmicGene619 [Symbiodinium microadriaticum]|uniref:Uncharacterized protein n=1 Tax=Symbiodinium microadriaticum TaxID=2951 RepID=A0A1Q9F670_SYMMI|nr:hypothetical protein AK812_SmicGene619 [Symbiodinium microadriaticum]